MLADLQVRILSLDPDESMKALGLQAVQAQPDSLLLLDTAGTEEGGAVGDLFLHTGKRGSNRHSL